MIAMPLILWSTPGELDMIFIGVIVFVAIVLPAIAAGILNIGRVDIKESCWIVEAMDHFERIIAFDMNLLEPSYYRPQMVVIVPIVDRGFVTRAPRHKSPAAWLVDARSSSALPRPNIKASGHFKLITTGPLCLQKFFSAVRRHVYGCDKFCGCSLRTLKKVTT